MRRKHPVLFVPLLIISATFGLASPAVAQVITIPPNEVPVRWCVLEGSATLTDPVGVKNRLNGRLNDANNFVYMPKANILLRSGLPVQTGGGGGLAIPPKKYPVIADTNPVGNPGDVINTCPAEPASGTRCETSPGDGGEEFNDIISRCRLAWLTEVGTVVNGVTAVQIRRYVTKDGFSTGWVGFGYSSPFGSRTVLRDDATISSDPQDKWISHELGHTLSLPHKTPLNGPDSDNLMQYEKPPDLVSMFGTLLTQDQVEQMRDFIPLVNALPVPIQPGDPDMLLANGAPDPLGDGIFDIDDFGVETDPPADLTRLVVGFAHPLPETAAFKVFFFADTDNDAGTGGLPGPPAFPAGLATSGGVDFVAQVEVQKNETDLAFITRIFQFSGGTFEERFDAQIGSEIETGVLTGDHGEGSSLSDLFAEEFNKYGRVKVQFPSAIPSFGPVVGLEAHVIPQEPEGSPDGTDRVSLSFEAPVFPTCEPSPALAAPGDRVKVKATGLPSDLPTVASLGKEEVAAGSTNSEGKDFLRFRVPLDARTGPRPLTVGIDDLEFANEATCRLTVMNCDVNGDQAIDKQDIKNILGGIKHRRHRTPEPDDPRDVNGDGRITGKDLAICVRVVVRVRKARHTDRKFPKFRKGLHKLWSK